MCNFMWPMCIFIYVIYIYIYGSKAFKCDFICKYCKVSTFKVSNKFWENKMLKSG